MQTEIDEIVIKGVTYVPKNLQAPPIKGDIRIVVLQRGWVAVGKFKRNESGEGELFPAAIIQTWGTTKGLPELVNGPTASTKLNKSASIIRFNMGSEILMIDADAIKWENHL